MLQNLAITEYLLCCSDHVWCLDHTTMSKFISQLLYFIKIAQPYIINWSLHNYYFIPECSCCYILVKYLNLSVKPVSTTVLIWHNTAQKVSSIYLLDKTQNKKSNFCQFFFLGLPLPRPVRPITKESLTTKIYHF